MNSQFKSGSKHHTALTEGKTTHSARVYKTTLELTAPILNLIFYQLSDNLSHRKLHGKQIMRRDTRSNVQVAWFMSGAPKPLRRSRTLAHALGQPAPYQHQQQQQQQRAPQAGFQTAPSYRRARWQRSRTAAQATSLLSSLPLACTRVRVFETCMLRIEKVQQLALSSFFLCLLP